MANILGKKQNANGDNVFAMSHSDIVKVRDKGALTEELYLSDVVPLPAVQQAYIIHSSQKWATTEANSTGYFVFVPDVTKKYRVTANSLVNSRVVALTANTFENNKDCSTFATGDYKTSRFPITAGESKVITLPSATKWLWIAGLSGSSSDATPSKIEVVVDTIKNGLGGEVEGVKDSVRNIVKSLNGSETPVYSGNVQQSTTIPVDIAVGDEFHVKVTKASGSAYISMLCTSNGTTVEYIANRCNTDLDFVFVASKAADSISMYSNSVASAFEITRIPKEIVLDETPTEGSDAVVKSGGVYDLVKSVVGDAAISSDSIVYNTIPSANVISGMWASTVDGVYVTHTGSTIAVIPLPEGYDTVFIRATSIYNTGSNIGFLTSDEVTEGSQIPYCTGTSVINIAMGGTKDVEIPSGATHLLVWMNYNGYDTTIMTPQQIIIKKGMTLSEYIANEIAAVNERVDDIANSSDGGYEEVSVQDGEPVPFFLIGSAGKWVQGQHHKAYILDIPEGATSMKVTPVDRCMFAFLDSDILPSEDGDDVDLFAGTSVYDITEPIEVDIPTGCEYVGFDFQHSGQGIVHDDAPAFLGFKVSKTAYMARKSKLAQPYSSLALDNMHVIMSSYDLHPLIISGGSGLNYKSSAATLNDKNHPLTLYWPWIVRTRHANALGKYYLYFSEDHVNDSPIYMQYSDDLLHWTYYGVVATHNSLLNTTGNKHDIETPTVIWDDYNERYLLFCHSSEKLFDLGYTQTSFISESVDGVNWTFVKPFVTIPKERFCGNFHNGYISIQKRGELWHAFGLIGGGQAGQTTEYYSYDALNWLINPNQTSPILARCRPFTHGETTDMKEIELRGGSVVQVEDKQYRIYMGGTSGSGYAERSLAVYISETLNDYYTNISKAYALTHETLDIRSINVFVDDDGEVYLLIMVRYEALNSNEYDRFYGFIAKLKKK